MDRCRKPLTQLPAMHTVFALLAAHLTCCGCGAEFGFPLPNESTGEVAADARLLARFVHMTDAQIVDEESPGRIAPAEIVVTASWRPQEAYSAQLLDGVIRAINRIHEQEGPIDFVIFTGDATDNHQANEWRWFLDVFDGELIDPLSGVDDRAADELPVPALDPHAPFQAAGLYRNGVHGDLPSIPWYTAMGNHDRFAVGTFPVIDFGAARVAPLPLTNVVDLVFPPLLNPEGGLGYGVVSPANPGPPLPLNFAMRVLPNSERRFLGTAEAISAHFQTLSGPSGHGFRADSSSSWYSVSPLEGLRLVVLDTARPDGVVPSFPYVAGTINDAQRLFLTEQLEQADSAGERVIVCAHHPSSDLVLPASTLAPEQFRSVLRSHPSVVLYLAGHFHRNIVFDRDTYLEIESGAIIDYPQEARLIEVYEQADAADIIIRYRMFSHVPAEPEEQDDLYDLRLRALELAREDAGAFFGESTRSEHSSGRWVVRTLRRD